jgi:hypothetical protein
MLQPINRRRGQSTSGVERPFQTRRSKHTHVGLRGHSGPQPANRRFQLVLSLIGACRDGCQDGDVTLDLGQCGLAHFFGDLCEVRVSLPQ